MAKTGKKNRGGRPLLFDDPEKLQSAIDEYFASCWSQKLDMYGNPVFEKGIDKKPDYDKPVFVQTKPYTVASLAVYLDCSPDTLENYENNKDGRYKKSFSDLIKKAKEKIFAYKNEFLYSGKNPTGAIFDLKANYGWKDKQEIDLTTKGKRITGFNYVKPAGRNKPYEE